MPEGFIGLAPDSTGAKVRTRSRTIGANVIHEQYLLPGKDAVVVSRAWLCTPFRVRSRASAAGTALSQPVFSIWNGHATNLVSVRRMTVEADTVAVRAQAQPWLRLYRVTAAPANGTAITPIQQDTADTALSATIAARGDFSTSDTGTMPTAMTATPNPTQPAWAQTVWRAAATTPTGYVAPQLMNMMPDDPRLNAEDPMILRPSQGVVARLETIAGGSVALVADDWTFHFKAVIGEFTYA